MPAPRDNLLEAFKDVSGKRNPVGGPFTGGGGGASASGGLGRISGARAAVFAVAALGLCFVVGVAVGRATAPADDVRAAEREADAGEGYALGALSDDELESTASGWAEPARTSAVADDESALSDPRNKYTVVAFTATPRNMEKAWESYDHLRAQDLPAFRPFAAPNGMVTIVVGAAPKESDLADVLSRLKRVTGPDGRGRPYESAYATPIKKLTAAEGGD